MKYILTETQYNRIFSNILSEASKKDILVNKLGFNPEDAEVLEKMTGNISVWLGKKLIEQLYNRFGRTLQGMTPEEKKMEVSNLLKRGNIINFFKSDITSIIDWYRVGLNGNIRPFENLTFLELVKKSKDWHESLEIGGGQINYNEENKIIRDYRENGFGFYWVDLETNDSPEECERMGHCGRTARNNTIYSLRESKKLNDKFTMNISHLTAAIGEDDGIIYQLKGPKNSKPKEIFFPYIVDLISNVDHIRGFGLEYDNRNDFKLTDLSKEEIEKIYAKKPEIFNTRSLRKLLTKFGIIDSSEFQNQKFELILSPDDVNDYVDGDWVIRRWTDKMGRKREIGFFESLLSGEFFDDFYDYQGDLDSALFYIDRDNENKIIEMLSNKFDDSESDIEDWDLKDLLEEYDENNEIYSALVSSLDSAYQDDTYQYFYKNLRDTLSEYGEVLKMDDESVNILVDIDQYAKWIGLDESELDELWDRCDGDKKCILREIDGYKPKFSIDNRWEPSADKENFNSILSDRLAEI